MSVGIERYNHLVTFLNDHYHEEIDIPKIEEISCYSYRNINRIFFSLHQETIGKYIRRIRLEKGAQYLKFTGSRYSDICIVFLIVLSACTSPYRQQSISFVSQGDTLTGVINLPKNKQQINMPLLIFVHGDGELEADAYGYYTYFWESLAEAGIATMAWDKKGVGKSKGNWLDQSMEDRAQEVIDAIERVKFHPSLGEAGAIGLIGFSQGCWVLPKVSAQSKYPDFMILVSGAINWKKQSTYMTRKRLEGISAPEEHIREAIQQDIREFTWFEDTITYESYKKLVEEKYSKEQDLGDRIVSPERFRFIQKNIHSDATHDLTKINCPVFALFGDQDRNVNYKETADVYRKIFSANHHSDYSLKIYSDATHSLLRSKHFDTQNPDLEFILKLDVMGDKAFADGVLKDIVSFSVKKAAEREL